jgi:hypothetical protein
MILNPLKITLKDRAFYFKGLLLLVCRDRVIRDSEKDLLTSVGRAFDYETGFCETTIREALNNPYLTDDPPRFSNPEIAACFIRDGIRLSMADGSMHSAESEWLLETALRNGLAPDWFHAALLAGSDSSFPSEAGELEALDLIWT